MVWIDRAVGCVEKSTPLYAKRSFAYYLILSRKLLYLNNLTPNPINYWALILKLILWKWD